MKRSSTGEDLVQSINFTFFPAKLLGLCNITYDPIWNRFKQSNLLSIYNRWVLFLWNLTTFILYPAIIYINVAVEEAFNGNDNNLVQERVLWFFDSLQLWFVIIATYWNQELNKFQLEDILNGILKCRQRLVKLTKTDASAPHKRVHGSFVAIRLLTIVLDIYCTAKRPKGLTLVFQEFKPMVFLSKLVMGALFFGWCLIQTQLTATLEALNHYVRNESVHPRAKDYQALSKICTIIYKVKRASRAYYGLFVLMTYSCLIRSVSLCYETMSVLLIHRYKMNRINLFVHLTDTMLISGVTPMVDVLVQGTMFELLTTKADKLRWSLLRSECKSMKPKESQRSIDTIMRQEFCEDISWASGPHCRAFGFAMILEAVCWVLTLLVYDSNNAMIFVLASVDVQNHSMGFYSIYLICGVVSIWMCKNLMIPKLI